MAAAKTTLTQARLKELLSYDPETGLFTRLVKTNNGLPAGSIAGKIDNDRIVISIDGIYYYAHRLAWLYMYGAWPSTGIDHKDRNPSNNKMANLREANQAANNQNRLAPRSDSKAGLIGVSVRSPGIWRARIYLDKKCISLGNFSTPEEAHKAYLSAKARLHQYWHS